MKNVSKFKNFLFTFLILSSLNVNADYTARFFVDGVTLKNLTPPVIGGDATEQTGGEAGHLTYTVSRTSGNNQEEFLLTVTSNEYNCLRITPPSSRGSYYDYCDIILPLTDDLFLYGADPGIYTFEVSPFNDLDGVGQKKYSFNVEVLPSQIPPDETGPTE
jgi:hypothetical protein